MAMHPGKITVLIPNYNGRSLLEENLPFVRKALENLGDINSEIIVSDDGSADDSIPFLKTHHPDVVVVESPVNTGFSGAVNRGLANSTGEWVLLLNSDVQLTPDYFLPQIPWLKDPSLFGIMGKIKSMDRTVVQDSAKYPGMRNGKIRSTLNYVSPGDVACPTLFLSGANALMRLSMVRELGGMNELFNPYYCEDVDLGLRAWRNGWKCWYEPQAVCYHPNSATIRRQDNRKVRAISRRNKAFLHLIHLDGWWLIWFWVQLFAKAVGGWVIGRKDSFFIWKQFRTQKANIGFWREKVRSKSTQSLPEIMRQIRKRIQVAYRF